MERLQNSGVEIGMTTGVREFWKNKRVMLTGHTGFKGAWLSHILTGLGAHLTGYALAPAEHENLYSLCRLSEKTVSVYGDIRDLGSLWKTFQETNPEIVIHMAAQPLVLDGYRDPVCTFETNVMGTVNVLECARRLKSVKSIVNVTTDKVYRNMEWDWGYRENDCLDGADPYSNSKSCSELVTQSFIRSFFANGDTVVSTARAGNVIGGGDFSPHRIIPDCVRSASESKAIIVRNPNSVRPYQHVLEPLFAYLMIAERQYEAGRFAGSYNVGPDECDCVTTGQLANVFCCAWGGGQRWENRCVDGPHEANLLRLDCSRLKATFGWKPRWHVTDAVQKTVEWSKAYLAGKDVVAVMDASIAEYKNGSGRDV